jgi:uncharacterized SAM-binding protein YcdF (DUF218 family)
VPQQDISAEDLDNAQVVWDFHLLGHPRTASAVAIVLGCPDAGVATFAAQLYHEGLFPLMVLTGATSASTAAFFPEGEAVAFRALAAEAGVPAEAMLIEPDATNTGANIQLSRRLLADAGIVPDTITLVTMPYMQRRAFATCRRQWPEVQVTSASEPVSLPDYLARFDDRRRVIDYMVGDLQRIIEYPARGFAIEQDVPEEVRVALKRLIVAGYDSYLIKPA